MLSEHEKQCFVIMPFKEKFDELFEFGIKPAVKSKNYQCVRMDQVAGTINLIRGMIHNIYVSKVIIADLTDKNANVFYELGIAHSIPVPDKTIMISEQDEEIPFDIGPFQVLKYKKSFKGITDLRHGIIKRIEFIETRPDETSNPVQDYFLNKKLRRKQNEFPVSRNSDSDEELFNQLYLSQIRITLLHFLNGLPEDQSKLSITTVQKSLNINRRKFVVDILYKLEADGLIEKEKQNQSALWHISNKGQQMLKKLKENIDDGVFK